MNQHPMLQPKTARVKGRRIGRGGKRGTYSGKGIKGQLARSGRKLRPELRDLIKKLPKMRGRGKSAFTSTVDKATVVNLKDINQAFEAGSLISPKTLLDKGLVRRVRGAYPVVKVLGETGLEKKFSFERVLFSVSAKSAIEKAGGKIG